MIISASRRTDIPCFYGEWLINRLREGCALVRSPFAGDKLRSIPLSPGSAECLVFWTKDAGPFLPLLDEVDKMGYRYYFQWTLTPYGRELEPNLRDKRDIGRSLVELSERIGRERLLWRYDPIILNEALTVAWHKEKFARLFGELEPYTSRVTVSFVDIYAKLRSPLLRPINEGEITELASFIGEAASDAGLEAAVCCEEADLSAYGIKRAACVDGELIEKLLGRPLGLKKDKGQRENCGCVESVDIGAYDTCVNGCVYCYANRSAAAAARRFASHDPKGALLFGSIRETDEIFNEL